MLVLCSLLLDPSSAKDRSFVYCTSLFAWRTLARPGLASPCKVGRGGRESVYHSRGDCGLT